LFRSCLRLLCLCERGDGQDNLSTAVAEPVASTSASTSASLIVARPQFTVTSPSGRLPIPYKFPLHNLRDSIRAALTSGELLRTGQRTELLEAVYQDVTKYTL